MKDPTKSASYVQRFAEKNPQLFDATAPLPIDHIKMNKLMRKMWPEIMEVNALLGLPVYEREDL